MAPSTAIRTVIITPDHRQERGSELYASTDIDTAIDTEHAALVAPAATSTAEFATVGWSELEGIPGATRLEEVIEPR